MKCNATALGITIQYPIPNEDKGCDQLKNTYCPIEPSTDAELEMNMLVDRIFPKVIINY